MKKEEMLNIIKEEIQNEGWKDWAAGAMMTAATMGGMTNNVQGQNDASSTQITQDYAKKITSMEDIKSPEDLISFTQNIGNYTHNEVRNLFNLGARRHFAQLYQNDNGWREAFNESLKIIQEKMRVGSEYKIILRSDAGKEVGKNYNIDLNKSYTSKEVESIYNTLNNYNLKEFRDYMVQVTKRGENFNKYNQYYNMLDVINWNLSR